MRCVRIHEYHLDKPAPDLVELDPEVYWSAAQTVIAEILAETAVSPQQITALGVTSQGETLIVLDRHGKPLRKAMVWLDNRAKAEAASIREKFGRDAVYQITGQQDVVPGWPAAKILWLRQHEPAVFQAAARFLMVEDYLIYRLTGRYATDHALNPSTLYYDLRHGCWWGEMLGFLRISSQQLPELLPSGASAGKVTAEIGLSRNTIVTVSPIDQISAAVGAGNISPGTITETTGSTLAICATVEHPIYDPEKRVGLYRHALPGLFVLLPWIPTAGMILRWFRDEFGGGMDYAALTEAAAEISPGSDGLVLLPHFSGMVSPEINPDAKGVFYGLSLAHRKAHLVRAILESVAFSLRDNLEMLADIGIACGDIISLGGAARSDLWLKIKADVLQQPVRVMRCEETTSLGAAVLAAVGSGLYGSVQEAGKAMVFPRQTISPDPKNRDTYEKMFAQYKHLSQKLFPNRIPTE
jgi:xylulokinase